MFVLSALLRQNLPGFLDHYDTRRQRSELGYKPHASILGGNNLLTTNN